VSALGRRREQRIDAYRDGALSPRARAAVERRLEADPAARARLAQNEALGAAVREVWSEGPRAPRVDLVIQSLRPEMARVDAELAERPGLAARLRALREALGPVPLALAGAAAVLALALASPTLLEGPDSGVATAGIAVPAMDSPSAIYDLEQSTPLLIYSGPDGATVIWILENPSQETLGSLPVQEF
jgi:anti-sigma factor RsiW